MNAVPSREPAGATVTSRQRINGEDAPPGQPSSDMAAPTASASASQQDKGETAAEPSTSPESSELPEAPESGTVPEIDPLPLEEQRPSPSLQRSREPASVAGFQFNGSQPFS